MNNSLTDKKILASAASLMLVIILFVGVTFFAQKYADQLQTAVNYGGAYGVAAYVLITAFAVVIAPVSTFPLIPLAVSIWGWVSAAVLSILGWVIGSQIAFFLARKYGRSLIRKIVSLEKLEKIEKYLPEKDLFWTVVLLRMTIPVDVLSYALGLFSRMQSRSYFLATLIGVTPFAFIFAYAGSLSLRFQIGTIAITTLFIIIIFLFNRRKER